MEELAVSLQTFLEPVACLLPDRRHTAVLELLVRGIVASQSPLVTQIGNMLIIDTFGEFGNGT